MEIGVVLAPDNEHAEEIMRLLHHKGKPWLDHVKRALLGEIQDLETRFYVGKVEGKLVGNIMTVEFNGTGILGHVFTLPEHRRKHVCSLIMAEQMEDFKRRSGRFLSLGTGFNSPPYWIYHSFGFRSVSEGSGFMKFSTEENFEEVFFSYSDIRIVDVQWKHWPVLNVLFSVPSGEILRSFSFRTFGTSNFEGGFLRLMERYEQGAITVKFLESKSGAVVGYIFLENDQRWIGNTFIMDLFVHPNFSAHYQDLINSIELPEGKVQCYVDNGAPPEKVNALISADFEMEALLKRQFTYNERFLDVSIFSRWIG